MNRILLAATLGAALFASCAGGAATQFQSFAETAQTAETPGSFIITDYKNMSSGGTIPEWVSSWLDGGSAELETLDAYRTRYTFVARCEGNNFNALTQWNGGFSPELDFPRLAAARIEARFSSTVPLPDNEYGSFYEALIRAASDAAWTGAVREDDFWIRRKFYSAQNQDQNENQDSQVNESWEFLVLVTIDKTLFASQLNAVFQSIKASPQPSKVQIAAANRVKDRFFDGF